MGEFTAVEYPFKPPWNSVYLSWDLNENSFDLIVADQPEDAPILGNVIDHVRGRAMPCIRFVGRSYNSSGPSLRLFDGWLW